MRQSLLFIGVLLVFYMVTGRPVKADPILYTDTTSLQSLLDGGEMQAHDKLFTNWEAIERPKPGGMNFGNIFVTPITDNILNPGLFYEFNGELFSENGTTVRMSIDFDVTVIGSEFKIKDTSLTLDVLANGPAQAIARQHLSFPPSLPFSTVSVNESNLFSDDIFDPVHGFHVNTAIDSNALELNENIDIISLSQRFSQTPTEAPIPEPATIALLGIGIVGLAGAEVRRRRKKKAVDES